MAGFSFGTGVPGSTGGFNFSTPTTTTSAPAPAPGFSFLTPTSTAAATSSNSGIKLPGFSAPTTPATIFSSNINPTNTTAESASVSSSTTPGTPLFSIPATSAPPSNSSFSLGLNLAKPTTSVAPIGSIGSTTTSAATSSFSFTPSTSTIPVATSVAPSSSFGPVATLSTATLTSSFGTIGAGGATNLSMRQLEERLNKWLVELKEQEERFLRQAAHVNAWDQILQHGHEQVQQLKDTLHTVKSDQSRLEAEIDFIRGQQEELERLLEPLESATNANPAAQLHQGDRQRDNMYYLAQSLDAQLRQMTDDLGKVIEHLNTNSGSLQPNDPVSLVARILSAHMDTLKWVDQNTTLLSQKVEDVARVSSSVGKRG